MQTDRPRLGLLGFHMRDRSLSVRLLLQVLLRFPQVSSTLYFVWSIEKRGGFWGLFFAVLKNTGWWAAPEVAEPGAASQLTWFRRKDLETQIATLGCMLFQSCAYDVRVHYCQLSSLWRVLTGLFWGKECVASLFPANVLDTPTKSNEHLERVKRHK